MLEQQTARERNMTTTTKCPHCGTETDRVTCGASECQQASALANKLRIARGSKKRRVAYDVLMAHCDKFGVSTGF